MHSTRGRERFLEIASQIRRSLDMPPLMPADPAEALLVRLVAHERHFDAIHTPDEAGEDRFVLQCRFGPLPNERRNEALRAALALNYELAETAGGMFALDPYNEVLLYSVVQPLEGHNVDALLEVLSVLADAALQWRQAYPLPPR